MVIQRENMKYFHRNCYIYPHTHTHTHSPILVMMQFLLNCLFLNRFGLISALRVDDGSGRAVIRGQVLSCFVPCTSTQNKYDNDDDDEEGSEKTKQTDEFWSVSTHGLRAELYCVSRWYTFFQCVRFFLENISRRFAFDGKNSLFLCQFRCDAARPNECSEAKRLYGCERHNAVVRPKHTHSKTHTHSARVLTQSSLVVASLYRSDCTATMTMTM